MNAYNQTFRGRIAALNPLDIPVPESSEGTPCQSGKLWGRVSTDQVSSEELYGCVDWYPYQGQAERESVDQKDPRARH